MEYRRAFHNALSWSSQADFGDESGYDFGFCLNNSDNSSPNLHFGNILNTSYFSTLFCFLTVPRQPIHHSQYVSSKLERCRFRFEFCATNILPLTSSHFVIVHFDIRVFVLIFIYVRYEFNVGIFLGFFHLKFS